MTVVLANRGRSRRARVADQYAADDVAWEWRQAAEGADLCRRVDTASGTTVSTPKVTGVHFDPLILTVRLLAGMLASDVRAAAHRIAPHLGGVALRVSELGLTHVRIEVLARDPLAREIPLPRPARLAVRYPLLLGVDEGGDPVTLDLATCTHVITQGGSGSGKSVAHYSLLAQLAGAPDVEVVGSDITGLLLAPWAARQPGRIALGTRNPAAHLDALAALVEVMDERVEQLPPGYDAVPLGPARPVIVAVIEELPGLLRVLDGHSSDAGKRGRALIARLLSEGRKAGIRCLLVTQRADSKIVGGFERGQASHTVSYRIDSAAGLNMLHAGVTPDQAAAHATCAPGVAFLSAPGRPLVRFRSPNLPYSDYVAAVAS